MAIPIERTVKTWLFAAAIGVITALILIVVIGMLSDLVVRAVFR